MYHRPVLTSENFIYLGIKIVSLLLITIRIDITK